MNRIALTIAFSGIIASGIVDAANCDDSSQGTMRRRLPGHHGDCTATGAEASPQQTAEKAAMQSKAENNTGQIVPEHTPSKISIVPIPTEFQEAIPVPDRWRLVDALGYTEKWYDPYNRNYLKGDKPLHDDWFFSLGIVSDTVYEKREVATPVGGVSTQRSGSNNVFGSSSQWALQQNLAFEFVYYKGDTTFRPPDYEFRFIPVINYNHTVLDEIGGVNADPNKDNTRNDAFLGIQGAFADVHLRNVSEHFDFDSIRVGIQPFQSDFRGFLFNDSPLGVRLFGNRDNNIVQYNIGLFRRIEKDTNSGLNDVGQALRKDDVLVANLYWQDMPVRGFTSQGTVLYNRNREDDTHYDNNDFLVRPASIGLERPHTYDVTYFGYNGDGHFGRNNLTVSTYAAIGSEKDGNNFRTQKTEIAAYFGAAELSRDFDWLRVRLSALYASGDSDPYDKKDTGFDAVLENPLFAGADSSYWIRQAVPLIGGGGVALSGRNGILPSLRSSKDEGQSNFTNPGLILWGIGADADILPELRISANWNVLRFENTKVLEVLRNQGSIDNKIGNDASLSLTYRPLMNQNIVLRASYAKLFTTGGYNSLFTHENPSYLLLNAVLVY